MMKFAFAFLFPSIWDIDMLSTSLLASRGAYHIRPPDSSKAGRHVSVWHRNGKSHNAALTKSEKSDDRMEAAATLLLERRSIRVDKKRIKSAGRKKYGKTSNFKNSTATVTLCRECSPESTIVTPHTFSEKGVFSSTPGATSTTILSALDDPLRGNSHFSMYADAPSMIPSVLTPPIVVVANDQPSPIPVVSPTIIPIATNSTARDDDDHGGQKVSRRALIGSMVVLAAAVSSGLMFHFKPRSQ